MELGRTAKHKPWLAVCDWSDLARNQQVLCKQHFDAPVDCCLVCTHVLLLAAVVSCCCHLLPASVAGRACNHLASVRGLLQCRDRQPQKRCVLSCELATPKDLLQLCRAFTPLHDCTPSGPSAADRSEIQVDNLLGDPNAQLHTVTENSCRLMGPGEFTSAYMDNKM